MSKHPTDHGPRGEPQRSAPDLFGAPVAMARTLGLVNEAIGKDYAQIRMPFNADFTNSRNELHGGALMALLDCAVSVAARSHDPAGTTVITVDMSTHFIASAPGDVIAKGRCLRRGRSLAFSQAEVYDEHGTLLATATATLKLVPRKRVHEDGKGG